ncbi:MAG: acyltransferase [Bacillota bacterium]|jgi:acetyltransferase-like isoleucine patch superfamily enzyme
MRRLTSHPAPGPKNSMQYWGAMAGRWRTSRNFLLIWVSRYIPYLPLKNALLRMTGMRLGQDVSIGLMVMIDVLFPHLITVDDDSIIGYNTTILAHEFLLDQLRTGSVRVGKRVLIGAHSLVLPGVEIGDGAVVSACSLVNRDVPPGARVGGVPARPLEERDA